MKKILYLTFYYEPDLCAGSFRNTPLIKELAKLVIDKAEIEVVTTLPNRYSTYSAEAKHFEQIGNLKINRVKIPRHKSGMLDQILSFYKYYRETIKLTRNKEYDLVVASSSRLFTAFLAYRISKKTNTKLYLDIRDIFSDTLNDLLGFGIIKNIVLKIINRIEARTFSYAKHINLISAGFKSYFEKYPNSNYTYFPNGVDEIFIKENESIDDAEINDIKKIIYAGNIGEGQGLDKIVPEVAKKLEGKVKFVIIGDGGAKEKLINELEKNKVKNVELFPPVNRNELIKKYKEADFLFVHLNDYDAFKKVLPSKLFELSTFPQPIIAGIGGYAANFAKENIDNIILFEPCNANDLIKKLSNYQYKKLKRSEFIEKYKRSTINNEMAKSIIAYL